MSLPEHSAFFSPTTGVNKVEIVRDALNRSDCVAFAGDGRPDLEPALMVEPSCVLLGGGWPRPSGNAARDSIRLNAGRRSRINFRRRMLIAKTNHHSLLVRVKPGALDRMGIYAERYGLCEFFCFSVKISMND